MRNQEAFKALEQYGADGVLALQAFTPELTGLTATSWYYKIADTHSNYIITWGNDNINHGFPIAIGLQYGHGTGTGGYVVGRDYINPAIRPVFDAIADKVWKAVTSA